MRAFYNEIDRYCCDWLSNLMDAGHITPGTICDRSIEDLRPCDLLSFDRVHMFAGIGVWDYALNLAGWGTRPVWTGSCPCQPFSFAGARKGFADERHLWPAWFHLIRECRPTVVFGEQVATASEWISLVLGDLEGMEYAVGCMPIEAASAGAPHRRDRLWFVADAERDEQPRKEPRSRPDRRMGREQQLLSWDGGWPAALARFRVVDDGIARCVEATDAARNAIVPQVAAAFIEAYLAAAHRTQKGVVV